MSNVAINLNYAIQAVDVTAAVTVFNRTISGFQLSATVWSASDFFQVNTTSTTISLPATTIFFVYVRNLGANNVTLAYTPAGGSSTSLVLLPVGSNVGGVFLYGLSAETAGGITALSATATTAVTPIEYFVGA